MAAVIAIALFFIKKKGGMQEVLPESAKTIFADISGGNRAWSHRLGGLFVAWCIIILCAWGSGLVNSVLLPLIAILAIGYLLLVLLCVDRFTLTNQSTSAAVKAGKDGVGIIESVQLIISGMIAGGTLMVQMKWSQAMLIGLMAQVIIVFFAIAHQKFFGKDLLQKTKDDCMKTTIVFAADLAFLGVALFAAVIGGAAITGGEGQGLVTYMCMAAIAATILLGAIRILFHFGNKVFAGEEVSLSDLDQDSAKKIMEANLEDVEMSTVTLQSYVKVGLAILVCASLLSLSPATAKKVETDNATQEEVISK